MGEPPRMRWSALVFALCAAQACTGGQSSDDGAPVAGASGSSDLGPTRPPNTGASGMGGSAGLGGTGVMGGTGGTAGSPVAGAGADPIFVIDYVPQDILRPVFVCAAGVASVAVQPDRLEAARAADAMCEGLPGGWRCRCGDATITSYAAGCIGALREACGVGADALSGRAEAPPDECASSLPSRVGSCQPRELGGYMCSCESAPGELLTRREATCEQALWAACSQACDDEYGSCTPLPEAATGRYGCACPYNGSERMGGGATCGDALERACRRGETGNGGCNEYGGYCERGEDGALACTCSDGSQHAAVAPAGERWALCRSAVEQACGFGRRPEGTVCSAEGNGYSARCELLPDFNMPYQCACVLRGTWRDRPGLIEELWEQRCEEALAAKCPETAALDAQDRTRACAHLVSCESTGEYVAYSGLTQPACMQNIPDSCVACIVAELGRGPTLLPSGCPDGNPGCEEACAAVVPKPAVVATCLLANMDHQIPEARAGCLCDRCHPAYGACALDYTCMELVACFQKQGCSGDACATDPVCGPLLVRDRSLQGSTIALAVAQCAAFLECSTQ
jgi:hypothetical protein